MVLFSDFDGTMDSKNNSTVLSHNLEAIHYWRTHGHNFIIVTGRNHSVINNILPDWQSIVDYIIFDNGGAIYSNQDKLIHSYELKHELVRDVKRLVCAQAKPVVYSPERYTTELMLGETTIKLRLYFKTAELFQRYRSRIEDQNWPIKVLPWPKAGFSKLPDGTDPGQFYGFLDIVPQNSGKECAIQYLMSNFYPAKQPIVVGDDYNDIDMFKHFTGYCIESGPAAVIATVSEGTVSSVAELIYSHL